MDERVKKMWVKALRSGKYEQTKGQLRYEERFCCLGVLADIYSKKTGRGWEERPFDTCLILGRDSELPDEILDWAGLTDRGACVELPPRSFYRHPTLAAQNDDANANFNRIADIIERYL